MVIQLQEDAGGYFDLLVLDESDSPIHAQTFSEIQSGVYQTSFVPNDESICDENVRLLILEGSVNSELIEDPDFDSGAGWSNSVDGFTDWSVSGGFAQIILDGGGPTGNRNSNDFITTFTDITSETLVTFRANAIRFAAFPVTGDLIIRFYKDGVLITDLLRTIPVSVGTGIAGSPPSIQNLDFSFLTTVSFDEVRFQAINTTSSGGSSGKLQYQVTEFSVYQYPIGGSSAKSDCLKIAEAHDETVLIEYSSNRNFAGLNYSNVTPDPSFFLRVPAIFFRQRFPQEKETIELSNSRSIQLSAQVKAQKHLQVKNMPDYMHRKLLLALSHQFVTIDGQDWVLTEEYELIPPSNPRWPMQKAQCWLTEKDYIMRSVL